MGQTDLLEDLVGFVDINDDNSDYPYIGEIGPNK